MTSANDELKIVLREYDMLSADDELGSARVLLHRLRERGGSSHIQAPVTLPKSTKQKGYVSLVLEFIPSRAAPANQLDAYPQHAPQPQAQPQEQVAMGYPAGSTYPDMYAQYPPIGTFGGASGHSAPQIATASGALPYPGMHGGHPAQPHAMHGPASAAGAPSAHHVHSYSGPSTSSGTTHIGPPPSGYPGGGAAAGAPAMHGYGAPPPIAPVGAPLGANGQYGQPVPQYHPGKPNKPHRPMKPGLGMGLAGGLAAGLLGGLILDDVF
uniref:C2 domain-containing protein n=2 Tax=Chlamydomonas euryale TaxID=1486919 RepID=A0A7R9VS66_9CHLO|mmetsp:Transcript_42255/g.126662  ORF Transcript_42255/g.126662 Transcript_42255/m.126662 type:complete len:268 (+) Transcript_42255:488-1291(+)